MIISFRFYAPFFFLVFTVEFSSFSAMPPSSRCSPLSGSNLYGTTGQPRLLCTLHRYLRILFLWFSSFTFISGRVQPTTGEVSKCFLTFRFRGFLPFCFMVVISFAMAHGSKQVKSRNIQCRNRSLQPQSSGGAR